jgi:hypothetical protein
MPQYYGGVRDEAAMVDRPGLLERRTKQTLALARLSLPRSSARPSPTASDSPNGSTASSTSTTCC